MIKKKIGHISPFGNLEIQQKAKDIVTEIYVEDNVFKIKEIQDNIN